MDFREYSHPNCGPCLHVLDNSGRVVLELPQLTRQACQPDPPLGYEVWSYTESGEQLGTVTYHATEETGYPDARPWCFEGYVSRYRREEGPKTWHATLPAALAGSWARGLELLKAERDAQPQINCICGQPRDLGPGTELCEECHDHSIAGRPRWHGMLKNEDGSFLDLHAHPDVWEAFQQHQKPELNHRPEEVSR